MYDKLILPGFKLFGNLDSYPKRRRGGRRGQGARSWKNNRFVRKKRTGNHFKYISEHAEEVRCKYLPGNSSE